MCTTHAPTDVREERRLVGDERARPVAPARTAMPPTVALGRAASPVITPPSRGNPQGSPLNVAVSPPVLPPTAGVGNETRLPSRERERPVSPAPAAAVPAVPAASRYSDKTQRACDTILNEALATEKRLLQEGNGEMDKAKRKAYQDEVLRRLYPALYAGHPIPADLRGPDKKAALIDQLKRRLREVFGAARIAEEYPRFLR